jgi:hypothetical protein
MLVLASSVSVIMELIRIFRGARANTFSLPVLLMSRLAARPPSQFPVRPVARLTRLER